MREEKSRGDFSVGSVHRLILRQGVPLILAELVHLLYNIVDRVYLGHLPGADAMALTGVGLTFPIVALVSAFTRLFGTGGAPIFAMARGAGQEERARMTQGTAFTGLALTSVLVFLCCWFGRRPILFLFGAGENSFVYADRYLRIYLWGTAFTMLASGMNGFINAQGFPRMGMLTVVLGAALNLVLDPILIFTLNMGVEGAALATVCSQAFSCGLSLWFFLRRAPMRLRLQDLGLRPKLLGEICRIGLAGFIMSATNCLTQAACNVTLQRFGGESWVGVMTILHSVREILSLPVSGITAGAQPVISFNWGARLYARVRQGIRFMSAAGFLYTLAAWLSVLFFAGGYASIFTSDTGLLSLAPAALRVYFFGFIFMALQMAGQSTFTSLGFSRKAIFFSLLRKAFIVTPLTFLLPLVIRPAVYGVFWAEPVSNVVGGFACFLTMYFSVYKTLPEE